MFGLSTIKKLNEDSAAEGASQIVPIKPAPHPNEISTVSLFDRCKYLWRRACEHDGITSTEKFPVFTADNPHVDEYQRHYQVLCKRRWRRLVKRSR